MAIILAIISTQALVLLIYLLYARVYFLLSLIFILLYIGLKYMDGDEHTGARAWPFLRNFTLFGKSVQYYCGNLEAFGAEQSHDRFLFVVVGNVTNMGLFHGFGMHGGIFKHVELVYMLPGILFKVPLLRDLLLWTGAVIHDETTLIKLLKRGKSVAYCPAGMEDLFSPNEHTVKAPGLDLFEFAIRHRIYLIPVLVTKEAKRYAIYRNPHIQEWFYRNYKWPFPFLFGPRILGRRPPPKLDIQVGFPMDASVQESPEAFRKLFMGQFAGLVETGGTLETLTIKS